MGHGPLVQGFAGLEHERAMERTVNSDATRTLVQSRNYCTDRLAEVKADIAKCLAEDGELKLRLETTTNEQDAGTIRRRRRYLSRYIDERKAERAALTTELVASTAQLKDLSG